MGLNVPKNVGYIISGTLTKGYHTARREVPVDTGELRDGIKRSKDALTSTAEHSKHVEYGTFKMPARPFMRTAYEDMQQDLDRKIGDIFK